LIKRRFSRSYSESEVWRILVSLGFSCQRPSGRALERVEAAMTAHLQASILKSGRVVFNIKANDYRLVAVVQYEAGVLMIRFFGSHEDHDKINAETI
jgi:mRNA-degrading endonuclease HigB of HigAB toxin-antitoxin module